MRYDVEVAWLANEVCNFDCKYCWLIKIDKDKRFLGYYHLNVLRFRILEFL